MKNSSSLSDLANAQDKATMNVRFNRLVGRALAAGAAIGLSSATAATSGPAKEPVDFINPMIGASTNAEFGEGKTFPGAARPFGLVQLSPDTITGGDNGSGYSYEHPTIEGFSFTHMSGVGWYGDLGNFQVMPTTGPRR